MDLGQTLWLSIGLTILGLISKCGAWKKEHFTINSQLPTSCGVARRYEPENHFELWGIWPWLGVLYYDGFGNFRCNAVLIHPEAVLTSLLCLRVVPEVVLQDHLFISFSTPGQTSFQNISVTHLDFAGNMYNTGRDIALMKLERPLETSSRVLPICLWEKQKNYHKQISGHIGMMVGSDLDNVYDIDKLRVYQAPVSILSAKTCEKIDQNFYNSTIQPGICLRYLRNPKDCHGIGSSLMFPRLDENGNIVWYLRGIFAQRAYYCSKYPFVPAFDLGAHRQWIESHFQNKIEELKSVKSTTSSPNVETLFPEIENTN